MNEIQVYHKLYGNLFWHVQLYRIKLEWIKYISKFDCFAAQLENYAKGKL